MTSMANHCEMARQKAAAQPLTGSTAVQNIETGRIDCCGFLTVVFDKIRKVEKEAQYVAAVPGPLTFKFNPPVINSVSEPPPAANDRIIVPEKIFIKNCVFLI